MTVDERTKIPLFATLAATPIIFGGVFWLSTIHAKAASAETKLEKLEQAVIDIATMKKDIEYIKEHMERGRK